MPFPVAVLSLFIFPSGPVVVPRDPLAQELCFLSQSFRSPGESILLFTYGKCSPEQSLALTSQRDSDVTVSTLMREGAQLLLSLWLLSLFRS